MVSKAREDLPDPDTPVTTVRVLCRTSKSMFLRLWKRAPRTTMLSVCVELDIERAAAATPNPKRKRSDASGWLTESFYYKGFSNAPDASKGECVQTRSLGAQCRDWIGQGRPSCGPVRCKQCRSQQNQTHDDDHDVVEGGHSIQS